MTIPIETTGIILAGDEKGFYVRVQDDTENTGGFLILTWRKLLTESNGKEAYDDWVENIASVENYFRQSKWLVEWDKNNPDNAA